MHSCGRIRSVGMPAQQGVDCVHAAALGLGVVAVAQQQIIAALACKNIIAGAAYELIALISGAAWVIETVHNLRMVKNILMDVGSVSAYRKAVGRCMGLHGRGQGIHAFQEQRRRRWYTKHGRRR